MSLDDYFISQEVEEEQSKSICGIHADHHYRAGIWYGIDKQGNFAGACKIRNSE